MPLSVPWFDAHLDLAYLAVSGRDMLAPLNPKADPHAPASITLPALAEGRVRFALGTIFTEVGGTGREGYPVGDVERAYAVGRAQLEAYLTWRDQGHIVLDRFRALRADPGLGEIRGGMGVANVVPIPLVKRLARLPKAPPLHIGILMENADPIRSPAELAWWKDRGVVAIGMSWARSSRYAGGNSTTDGLSDLGRELAREMDRLNIIHDCSHLSDRAFDDLCAATDKPLIASHSNCRALLKDSDMGVPDVSREIVMQRHLTDAQIREIAGRGRKDGAGGGVVGLNLYSRFLSKSAAKGGRASIDEAIAHIEHICSLTGSTRHVGLGSDMDGGFSADRLPEGIDSPSGLVRLADALNARNWSDDDIHGFVCGNWLRMFA